MNCRDAQRRIFAERDGALDETQRAALAAHVAECAACRELQKNFATAIESWRRATQTVAAPDAEREWHHVRRRIRGGVAAGEAPARSPRARWVRWLALPVGAAAALAIALWTPTETPPPAKRPVVASTMHAGTAQKLARADAVEISAADGSVVFVDDKSGWVVVWDGDAKRI